MMRTYRGIVCEKNKNDMVFMTDQGEFLRGIPLVANAEVGEEVEFQLVTSAPLRNKKLKLFVAAPVLAAAIVLLLLTSTLFTKTANVYAYIQLEGETSIEIGIDEDGKVISVSSDNQELPLDHWKDQPVDQVLADAIKQIAPNNEDYEIKTKFEKQDQSELNSYIENTVKESKEQINKPVQNIQEKIEKEGTIPKDNKPTEIPDENNGNNTKQQQPPSKAQDENNGKSNQEKTNNSNVEIKKSDNYSNQNQNKQTPNNNNIEKEHPNKDKEIKTNDKSNGPQNNKQKQPHQEE
ncbi:anti-sigma factor domain-containing protein [Lysinibacillus sp. BW-2-10]|uniref:anti-sigma factor domain-containing protein n=1 Tax=Lysinibacillus sp. BW-2-10 TaxID=2590030 RepID=UPI00118012F3|nr:anti-sigma factor domain-containing protein [Lysinibacillus sp. BW-2-10]TSI09729.1 anti-sigma factor domain-containing protein [Lysinibacillus sp. BW-2-10]